MEFFLVLKKIGLLVVVLGASDNYDYRKGNVHRFPMPPKFC